MNYPKILTVVLAVTASLAIVTTAHAQAPSDPQIVGIVQAANRIDINTSTIALSKTTNSQVKEFANQMVTDHTTLEKAVSDLAKKEHITPETSATSNQLNRQATAEDKKLRSLSGAAFDREYISHEVAFHQAVIQAATTTLIPNAKNAELKSALQNTAAPLLQGHLQHAQQVEKSLGS